MAEDLKLIAVKISRTKWLQFQIANLPRGTMRKLIEGGIDNYTDEQLEENLLEEIKKINSELNLKQKLLSQFREKKLEEELRLQREEESVQKKLNSCFGCGNFSKLKKREGYPVCVDCRSNVKRYSKFRKKIKEIKVG